MPKDPTPHIDPEQPLSFTLEQIAALVNATVKAQSDNNSSQFQELVAAIIESRKPYVDPKAEENDKAFREGLREQERNKKIADAQAQAACPHEKGSSGSQSYGQSAFWIHRLDTGETIGVCSQCGKVITSLNPDHIQYFRKRGDNLPSAAGTGRIFLDPIKAQTARLTPDERKETLERLVR